MWKLIFYIFCFQICQESLWNYAIAVHALEAAGLSHADWWHREGWPDPLKVKGIAAQKCLPVSAESQNDDHKKSTLGSDLGWSEIMNHMAGDNENNEWRRLKHDNNNNNSYISQYLQWHNPWLEGREFFTVVPPVDFVNSKSSKITLLRVIPTMTFQNSHVRLCQPDRVRWG